MQHTLFAQSNVWQTHGTYYDDQGNAYALTGSLQIEKNNQYCSIDAYIDVQLDIPTRLMSTYQFAAMDNPTFVKFQVYNPLRGMLNGELHYVDKYILGGYVSFDEIYSCTEIFTQIDERNYNCVSVLFKEGKRISAWTAHHTRNI